MSEPRLSSATQSLLRAAKADAPNALARAKVWSGVASTVGGAAGAAGAASGASTAPGALLSGGAGASKMLALGTLLGGTVTVGLAAMLLRIGGAAPTETPRPSSAPMAALAAASPAGRPDPPLVLPLVAPPVEPPLAAAAASPRPTAPGGTGLAPVPRSLLAAPVTASPDDALGREASLVAQAREALGRGDTQSALRAVRAARMLPSHQLGPEELAVEARALRALGKDDEAKDVDSTLRKRFPESALAR
jgi:hypothetical protein